MPRREIPPERRALHTAGMIVAGVGLLSFLSVFVSGALHFGDFADFEARGRSMALRAVLGMIAMIVGGAMQGIGRTGLAGSGIVLDPEQARRDTEPWNRMTGGMIADAIDEARQEFTLPTVDERQAATFAHGSDAELPFDEKLRRLHALYEEGILTRDEYERKKREWLDGERTPGQQGA